MDDDECSVDLRLCLEDDEEGKKERERDQDVMKGEMVMHISGEALQTPPESSNASETKTTEAEGDVVDDHSNTHEPCGIEKAEEVVLVDLQAGNGSKGQKRKEDKMFPCQRCGLVSGSSANLKKHMMTHTGEKPFKCRSCLKTFRQRHHLVDHWRIHSGERPFECEVCGKHFVQKSSLNLHKKKHLSTKAFSCNECNYATYQKTHLRIHMRKHTGERPYQCEKCGQTFSSSTRLKYHRMIHTGERRYKCEQCGVPFREKGTLQAHLAVHLNVGPFTCEECGQEFSRLAGLSLHRRVHLNKDNYLYVYNKEANKSFNSAIQKASYKVNPLKRRRAQESKKTLSLEGVGESDTDDADKDEEAVSITPREEMRETATPESHQTAATPTSTPTNAPTTSALSPSPEDKAAARSKLPVCSSDTDQHKLKENLASSLKYNAENSTDVNPDQVREALEKGTVLETHSDNGKGFFIVLPPSLLKKNIIVLSDPSESTPVAAIHIPDSSVTVEERNTPLSILSEGVLETDKVPYPSIEEEVRECDMDSVRMEEGVCSEGEGEMMQPCEAESVECILSSNGPEEVLEASGGYSEAIEEHLHPDGTSLLLWKDNSSNKFTKVTCIIEDGKKEPIIIEEESCAAQPQLKDGSPAGRVKRRKLKGSENTPKKSDTRNSVEPGKPVKVVKKSRITKPKTQRVYNCEHCGKTCKNSSNYIAHLRIHSGERPYFCGVCRMGFKQISHLKSHSRIHTGERPYVCNLCNAAFTQSSRLNAHKKSLHPNGQVEVKEKKKKYTPENRIKNFFCRYCNKTFIGECLKIDHMKLHQPIFPFTCKICNMQFKSKSTMVNHVLKHSDFKHICELCGVELLSIEELQKHKSTVHDINAPNGDEVDMYINVKIGEERNFVVLNPAMKDGKWNLLPTEVKAETSQDPDPGFCEVKQEIIHVTDVDGDVKSEIQEVTSTQDEDEVAIHDITHLSSERDKTKAPGREDAKPLTNQRDETSSLSDDKHEVVMIGRIKDKKFITYVDVTGKKVWVCKVCDHSFTQSSNLYCHMRMHTGDKPYQCNVCPKAFRQITHLKDHMRRHTGAKPHKCSACGKCFTQRSAARRHIMVVHKGKAVTERIPESQMGREIINTLSNECGRLSRGARKAALEGKDAALQGDESCKLPQKENVLHVCKVCNRRFTHSAGLGAHKRRCGKYKKQKVFPAEEKCFECGKSFVSHSQLLKHQKSCSAQDDETGSFGIERSEKYKRKITSRLDSEEDSEKDDEKGKHEKRESPDNNSQVSHNSFPCRQCGKVLSSIATLKAHMEGHSGEVQQLCMLCGEAFKRASALRYHQSMKHGREDRRYKDYCPSGYTIVKEEHSKVEKAHLEESESEYEEMDNLASTEDEEEEMISDVEVNTKVTPRKKTTSSPETNQERAKRGALKTISNEVGKVSENGKDSSKDCTKVTENGTYVCVACGVAFTRSSKLKHHKAMWCKGQHETHNADDRHKPLKENSPSKGNKLNRKTENQRKSLKSKKKEKPSDSPPSAIVQNSLEHESDTAVIAAASTALDSKVGAGQSASELHCKDCDKHFPDKHSFDEHLPTHEADRPFKCELCSMRFKRKAHLFNHYRRHISLAGVECL